MQGIPLSIQAVCDRAIEKAAAVKVARVDLETEPLIKSVNGSAEPLHSGQRSAWRSAFRFVCIFAGIRSGKTEIGAWLLLREIQRQGPGDYAVIGPNYPMLMNKARPLLGRAIRDGLGDGCYRTSGDEWYITEAGQMALWGEVRGETRILFRHAGNSDAIAAFDAKGIWVDEPGMIDDSVWPEIRARVSIGLFRIFFTSRPYRFNWYVNEMWHKVMDKFHRRRPDADPEIDVINFRSIENPGFDRGEYESRRATMPGWLFSLMYEGIPTKPAGLIYDCFDEREMRVSDPPSEFDIVGTNVWPQQPIPKEWPTAIGMDFGPNNTAAVIIRQVLQCIGYTFGGEPVWGAPTGLYIVERDYLGGMKEPQDHIKAILGDDYEPIMRGLKPQPLVSGGNVTGEQSWRGWYTSEGLGIAPPVHPGLWTGINQVYGYVKMRRLVVMTGCTRLLWEFENYARELNELGEPTDDIENKSSYHCLDATRYVVSHFPPFDTLPPLDDAPRERYDPNAKASAYDFA